MLIQFSVENYLSIKDKVVLFLLSSRDNEHPEHLIADGNRSYLKPAIIYRANAPGKSSILNVFWFMVNYVLTSHSQQLHKTIARSSFKFDPRIPTRLSGFEVIFITEGVWYAYGFSVADKTVAGEYLYHYPSGKQALIFERKNTKDFRFTIDVDERNTLKGRTPVNKLYLSVASNWSYVKVIPILEWFASYQITTESSAADACGIEAEQLKDDDYRRVIVSMLRVADLGVQTLQMRDSDPASSQRNDIFANIDVTHMVHDASGNVCSHALNMAEESDGTNSHFRLTGVVKKALDLGTPFMTNETDTHLRPPLTKYLVSFSDSAEFSPKGAQSIFASYSINLLDLDFLRRDQIWFTEKDEQIAATDLFSLYNFSIRKDIKVEKGYSIGRFGTTPFIKRGLQNDTGTD